MKKPVPRVEVPAIEEDFSSGWYLRGDIGGTMHTNPGLFVGPRADRTLPMGDPRFDRAFFGGLGLGFKYQSVRIDITGDWRASARLAANDATSRHSFAHGSQTLMLNGYYDLAIYKGITPYLGAGLGLARHTIGDHQVTNFSDNVTRPGALLNQSSRYYLAWSLMAGMAFDITPQFKLDIGYRYLNRGNLGFSDRGGNHYALGNAAAHEVRIGLRYTFGDGLPSRLLGGP